MITRPIRLRASPTEGIEMSYPHGCTAKPEGKKKIRSSAALAVAVGLALGFVGPSAMAQNNNNPIPGVDIIVRKNPGGIAVSAPTSKDGSYEFTGLEPGQYDLTVGGQRVEQAITVGAERGLTGMLKRNDDGTASITVGKGAPVVLRGQIASWGGGIHVAAGDINSDGVERAAPLPKGGDEKSAFKIADNESPRPTDRSTGGDVKDGDGNPGDATRRGGFIIPLIAVAPASPPTGDEKLPGKKQGEPIAGIPVGLEGDPGSIKVSTKTDANGAYNFTKLPAGKYKVLLDGQPPQSVTVGADGAIGGNVVSGSDGKAMFTSFEKSFLDSRWNATGGPGPGTGTSTGDLRGMGFDRSPGSLTGPGAIMGKPAAGAGPTSVGPGGGAMGPKGP